MKTCLKIIGILAVAFAGCVVGIIRTVWFYNHEDREKILELNGIYLQGEQGFKEAMEGLKEIFKE